MRMGLDQYICWMYDPDCCSKLGCLTTIYLQESPILSTLTKLQLSFGRFLVARLRRRPILDGLSGPLHISNAS